MVSEPCTYDAICFDFDGVLVESPSIKKQAFVTLYREFGSEVVAGVLAHHAAQEGISRLEKIRHCHKAFLGADLSDDEVAALGRRYSTEVESQVVACAWVAGAKEFLETHHRRLPLYIISGTPEDELRRITDQRGMSRYFSAIYGSPRRKEPILEQILFDNGYATERILFIGDAMTDYDAAMTTGVPFLGRVAPGRASPFPQGTKIIPDLTGLRV